MPALTPGSEPAATAPSTPTPTPSPTATSEPLPEPPPGTTPPVFAEIAEEVSAVRNLRPAEPVDARIISQEDLADVVSEVAFSDLDERRTADDERLLATLRLIPRDLDLSEFVESLYREQVLGLYVLEDEVFYVRTRSRRLSPLEAFTSAHEITHALQDQAFDLESLQDLPDREADASLALLALIEGDAVVTQQRWSARHQTESERSELVTESQALDSDVLEAAPAYLQALLAFPYREGSRFVSALHEDGGFAAVDDAFADPPTTTEQVLHPERYMAGEGPVDVAVPTGVPAGWKRSVTYTVGEFDLHQLLLPLGNQTAATTADGWGGGEVALYRKGRRAAVAGLVAFDSRRDAAEACDALPRWYTAVAGGRGDASQGMTGDRDAFARACTETAVRFAVAPHAGAALRFTQS